MSWTPIGPGFVFGTRALPFTRISARNEYALQGLVSNISVSPLDAQRIYVVSYWQPDESAAFATTDGGTTWRAITDSIRNVDPTIAPSCIAAHPTRAQSLFLGTGVEGRVHVSDDGGGSWSWSSNPIGTVRALLVDPRASSTLATTNLYAATDQGIWYSSDGGQTFALEQAGDAWSLAGYFPSSGTAHVYATVWQSGLYHATAPGSWQLLNGLSGTNLPAAAAAGGPLDFQGGFVDYCPRNPGRVYLWLFHGTTSTITSAGLFVSDGVSPLGAWTNLPVGTSPNPLFGYYRYYAGAFAVAPNSPGDGANDILFFNGFLTSRSHTSGTTWNQLPYGNPLHPDGHALDFHPDRRAYYPETLGGGTPPIPLLYAGTDGGLELCSGYADPSFTFGPPPTAFNEGATYDANLAVPQNLNQGRFCNRLNRSNIVNGYPALGYIGSTDTGVAAGAAAPGWRSVYSADSGIVAAAPGSTGMTVWATGGAQDAAIYWTSYYLQTFTDPGDMSPGGGGKCALPGGIQDLVGTSSLLVGLDGKCLTGLYSLEPLTTLPAGVPMTGMQVATPASIAGISAETVLWIKWPGHQEKITVDSVTGPAFTADFYTAVPPGAEVHIERAGVGRIDPASNAAHISQIFGQWEERVYCVAAHPSDADILYCATADQRVWFTNSGSTAGPGTVWTEIAGARPMSLTYASMPYESTSSVWTGIRERATSPVLCAVAVDAAGNAYALLSDAIAAGGMMTPLFQLTGGTWVPQSCSGLPDLAEGQPFSILAADPVTANVFYVTRASRIFVLAMSGGAFSATEVTENLPGSRIHDLQAFNAASPGDPARIVLRAATAIRGQWEREVTTGASTPAHLLYLRDNRLDTRWFNHCPDYAPDPFLPGHSVYHWECEDIKVDVLQPGGGSMYYQSDPEGTPHLSATQFDVLQNASAAIPSGSLARVHVRVQNGGTAAAAGVKVWVLWCKPAGGVPLLDTSASPFLFWSQFSGTGDITPALPGDSPWHPVAPPSSALPSIPPGESQVATFEWTVPAISMSDDGHYCLAAFVTSPDLPLTDSSYSVDEIVVRAKQVGQKNVHIGPPLTMAGMGGGGSMMAGGAGSGMMLAQIHLHGTSVRAEESTMEIDLSTLPKELELALRLGLDLKPSSVQGAARVPSPSFGRSILAALLRIAGFLLERIGKALETLARTLVGPDLFAAAKKLPAAQQPAERFGKARWTAPGGTTVAVHGLRLPPRSSAPMELAVRLRGPLEPGSRHVFVVRQLEGKRLIGGSTYVVRIAGSPKRILKTPPMPEDHDDID